MLRIKNINIIYNREIIRDSNFIVPNNSLVVIKGSSGSGKTSLIRNIILEEQNFDEYLIGDNKINLNNLDEVKKSFISLMDQQNSFIEELTVKEHFNLISNLYNSNDNKELIDKLDLNQVLNKYPNQLSGGEKTRIALVLCILKKAPIIILDEPTSSLDSYYTEIVVEILETLANNHMIIVASHDETLFDKADFIYEIKNKKLVLIKGEIKNKEKEMILGINNNPRFNFRKYLLKMKKYHLASNLIMLLLVSLSITVSSVGIYFGINKIVNSYKSFEALYDNEINIYKPLFTNTKSYYTAGKENYFTQGECDEIKKISGVKEIYSHLELSYTPSNYTIDNEIRRETDVYYAFSLYNENKLIKTVNSQEQSPISAISYNNKNNYDKYIETKYNDVGVYLTKEFANLFDLENIKEGSVLKFTLLIPLYKESGDMEVTLGDSQEFVPGYPALCKPIEVELPIAGVLEGMDMGVWSRECALGIFVPLDYYEEQINLYLPTNSDVYYFVEEIEWFKRDISNEDTVLETVTAVPWRPDTLTLKLDSIKNYKDVAQTLENMGYSIMTSVSFFDTMENYAYNISDTFIVFSIVILIILIIINFVLKFVNRNYDYSIITYLKKLGYSTKQTKKVLASRYRLNFYLTTITSIIFVAIYYIYTFITKNYLIPLKFEYLFIILSLALIIEYGFPKLFFRGDKK